MIINNDLAFDKYAMHTQILMEGPKAAHSQYLLGEKHSDVMMSLWSKVWRCLPSFKSHSIAFMSLPPEAQREPSGETVTVFKYPEWPKWLIFSLQLVRCQTYKKCILIGYFIANNILSIIAFHYKDS